MSNMAEYALIFETGTGDDWVEKRKHAITDIRNWFKVLSPLSAVSNASIIAASIASQSALPPEIAAVGEENIQKYASSFVRSVDQGELQIKVLMMAAAIDLVSEPSDGSSWNTVDALAAAFWSALWFQSPLAQIKVEKIRQDLLQASRTRVRRVANAARERRTIPLIGTVNIDQNAANGAKVNHAFSRAVEPMVSAMRENAALDREELDFMWWLLSDRSEILDIPFAGMHDAVRAVVAGLDAAAKLRRLPADAHRNIVLRNIVDSESLSLIELIEKLGSNRNKLAENLRTVSNDAPAVFPLIAAIKMGVSDTPFANEKISASEWGARALLEGAIHHLQAGTVGGL